MVGAGAASQPFLVFPPSFFTYGGPIMDLPVGFAIPSEDEVLEIAQPDQPLNFVHQVDAFISPMSRLLMKVTISL